MLHSKGQINAAKAAGISVEEYVKRNSPLTIDVEVKQELDRDAIKEELKAKGIEFKPNASTKSLNKLLKGE